MKKIALIFIIILLISFIIAGHLYFNPRTDVAKRTIFAFDTIINLTVSSDDGEAVLDQCEKEIYRLDSIFNAHSSQSEVSLLNDNGADTPVKVSEELYGVIERSIEYSKETHGAFDITIKPLSDLWDVKSGLNIVPSDEKVKETLGKVSYTDIVLYPDLNVGFSSSDTKIDLGGVAKGYAADRLKEIIEMSGSQWALIDLGGNIYCVGDREFRIGIQHPDKERGEYFDIINIKDKSVVTGGGYERGFEKDGKYYHHILSPFDGYPAFSGLKSVTVTGCSSEMCDAYSTAVYVYGKALAEELCEKNKDISFILMDNTGKTEKIN